MPVIGRSWRRRFTHGARPNDSSCFRPASRHNFFLKRSPSFSATACNWFMIRIRACTIRCRCHSNCRRFPFSRPYLGRFAPPKFSRAGEPTFVTESISPTTLVPPSKKAESLSHWQKKGKAFLQWGSNDQVTSDDYQRLITLPGLTATIIVLNGLHRSVSFSHEITF